MPSLFDPLPIGPVTARNRVFMAPLTRMRADEPGDVPNALMADYYRQRASAGLIVSEGTQISAEGKGYMATPGIHTDAHVAGWRSVVDGVHAQGGLIAAQLWHTGRVNHPSLHDGEPSVSASALAPGYRTTVRGADGHPERVDCPVPRPLELDEMPRVAADYAHATGCARDAGFDLVEIHAAHGYLLHQFAAPTSNQRTDGYGGTLENRCRLMLEVVDAVCGAWSPDRVGIRISPVGSFSGCEDPDGEDFGVYLAAEFERRGIAFLHLSEPDWMGGTPLSDGFRDRLRSAYSGVIVAAGSYDLDKADRLLSAGLIDAVAFGRPFIANPDLPRRLREGLPLNPPDPSTFYGGDAHGYTDYPTYSDSPNSGSVS